MSGILLWSLIPAFPHHFLSPRRNAVAVLVPAYASSYLSLLGSPHVPRCPTFHFLYLSPHSRTSLIPSFSTGPSHSSVLSDGPRCTADMSRVCVCVCLKCVCVSVWLVADKTSHCYPLRQTCVAVMIRRPHTHSILHIYTRMHFNKPLCTRIYMHAIGHSHTGGFANIVVHIRSECGKSWPVTETWRSSY